MNQLHKSYLDKFKTLKELYQKYDFSTAISELDKEITDISDFKVTVPLVGGFSTGKSTLLNTLIGSELLSTDIKPETAVPAEMTYGNDSVVYCMKDNSIVTGMLSELNKQQYSVSDTSLIKITLNNEFFKSIQDIRLVDMPGFDSGIEIHNRAINDYLPKSLAYIIAVSADEGAMRSSILNFLTELKLNEMPVYIVVTKSDKVPPDELDGFIEYLRQIAVQKMNISDIKIAVTSSADNEIDEFREILIEIQSKSDEIFTEHYNNKLKRYTGCLQSYLKTQISAPDTNLIQVQEDKKLLEESIAGMQKKLEDEKQHFAEQAERCIESIRSKVESELRGSTSVFENIVLQGGNVQEKVNFIVRNAITAGIREQLEPKLQKYVSNVSDLVSMGNIMTDTNTPLLDKNTLDDNEARRTALQSAVTPVTTVIATVVGSIFGPIGTVIGAIAGSFLGSMINKYSREHEEAQKRDVASQRVQQIIGEVLATVRPQIEATVHKMIADVNCEIDTAISAQIEMKKKELNDLEINLSRTEQEQNDRISAYKADLKLADSIIL